MAGFTFSQQDEALWDNIVICGEDISAENKQLRFRTPLQIPDLLLIKAWQARIDGPKTLDDLTSDSAHADILEIYPPANWKEKFEQKALTTELFYPIESATENRSWMSQISVSVKKCMWKRMIPLKMARKNHGLKH